MIRRFIEKERPLKDVPLAVILLLVVSLAIQLVWHSQQQPAGAKAEDLPRPMSPTSSSS